MFEKNKENLLYVREDFSVEEELYKNYIAMRKSISKVESMKYENRDKYLESDDFKQGFIAGVKIMSSILLDL